MSKTIEYKVLVDAANSAKTLGDLEKSLADINEELKGIEPGSEAFKELSKSAQEANKQISKINKEIEGITSEDKIRGLDGAVKLLGGSVQGLVGGLGLLGIESETFGKFEEAAASAISFGIGIKDVSEGIGQLGPLFNKSGIAAKLFGSTTKKALIATGVGAFAVALGTIIAYWDDIVKGIEKFGEKVPFVGKAIQALKDGFQSVVEFFRPVLEFLGIMPTEAEKANQAVIESNNALIESGQRELALLQARGAAAEEIYNKRKELLEKEIDNLKRNEAEAAEIYKKETELLVLQAAEEKRIADEKKKTEEEVTKKQKEEADKRAEERKKEVEDAKAKEEKRLEDIQSILETYIQKRQDIEANTNVKRVNLEEQRALEELEQLKATEDEKEAIRAFYRERRKEAEDLDAEERKEKELAASQEAIDALYENIDKEFQLEMERVAMKQFAVDSIIGLVNAETAVGKAALIAKQIINAKELVIEAKAALSSINLSAAKAAADTSTGFAATLKAGFPQNVPLLIAYAAQAASIVSAIKQAVSGAKQQVASVGVSGGGIQTITPSAPSTPTVSNPSIEQVAAAQQVGQQGQQPPVKAYVISGDVTSAQEAEQKIRQRRTVGR